MTPPYTYRDLCKKLQEGTSIKTFSDFTYRPGNKPFEIPSEDLAGKKTLMLRHDVDYYPELAYEMACVEADQGIRSTYYILTTDSGSKWWDDKALRRSHLKRIAEIQGMGHEVGLHYDFFGDYFCDGVFPEDNIKDILEEFSAAGIEIVGSAAHGSLRMRKILGATNGTAYPKDYVNYKIWEECNTKGAELFANGRKLRSPALSLKEYGLRYEAYWITRDWYFSDSRGKFWAQGRIPRTVKEQDKTQLHPHQAIAMMREGEVMQILIHPIWWKDYLT